MKNQSFVLKGHILDSETPQSIRCHSDSYLVCEKGRVAGVFSSLPTQYAAYPLTDWGDRLIIPGLVDLHLHAPQYSFSGLYMDLELLDWLNRHTFPEEAKYADMAYAQKAYAIFVDALIHSPTTRASIFSTLHLDSTYLLMEMLEKSGLHTYVGKTNMDRNAPDILREKSANDALAQTEAWLQKAHAFRYTHPILTPRFIPTCTPELMRGLSALQKTYALPVQSHLSENPSEVTWVKKLCPSASSYADAYDQYGFLGGRHPSIMAHCVYVTDEEIALMKARKTFVAHCPQSNTNLSSGIAPVRRFMQAGLHIGLGTDIAGGHSLSMFRAITDAVQVSKLFWRLVDQSTKPLTFPEAFYLATKGGGSFFGSVGGFDAGYAFDALVLDESAYPHPQVLTPPERLERYVYLAAHAPLHAKYVAGQALFENTLQRKEHARLITTIGVEPWKSPSESSSSLSLG